MDLREGRPQHDKSRVVAIASILVLAALLRLPLLGSNPPGLYCDEAAIAYDAWLVGKTGADHHGERMPLYFRSFGEWKNPLYVYADVPFVAALGMTPLAARLPAALFGIATVFVTILFVEALLGTPIALLAGLSLAVSPWHVTLSRSAFEANAFPLLFALGFWLFRRDRALFAGIAFGLCWYAYAIARVIVPLAWIAYAICWRREIAWKRALASVAIAVALWTPGILFAQRTPDADQRIRLVGVHTLDMWKGSFAEKTAMRAPAPIRNLVRSSDHAKRAFAFVVNYQSHFSPQYLLLRGDPNGRHGVQRFGLLLHAEALFLFAGIGVLWWRRGEPAIRFLIALLFIAPIPPSLTLDGVPHSIRMLGGLAALSAVSALGAWTLWQAASHRRAIVALVAIAWLASFAGFLRAYFVDYRNRAGEFWQQGSADLVRALVEYDQPVCRVRLRSFENLHVFWGFWREAPPEAVLQLRNLERRSCKEGGARLEVLPAKQHTGERILGAARDGEGTPLWYLVVTEEPGR